MRSKMLFGTKDRHEMITPPLASADMSPRGWGTEASYLSGGAFVMNSLDSHREFVFEWGASSSRQEAMKMHNFRNGVYSRNPQRDLFYFNSPNIYGGNMLPQRWAQPSINYEDSNILTPLGKTIGLVNTPSNLWRNQGLPLTGLEVEGVYSSRSQLPSNPSFLNRNTLYTIQNQFEDTFSYNMITVWAEYGSLPGSGVYLGDLISGSIFWGEDPIPSGIVGGSVRVSYPWNSLPGHAGFTLAVVGSVKIYGMRLFSIQVDQNLQVVKNRGSIDIPNSLPPIGEFSGDQDGLKWVAGMGHSGCKFVGNPTWVEHSGVNGGQVGYAATLREVGDWQL